MQLNYKVFGSGEPLIILHGLLGSLDNWQSLAKKYAEHFTVFIVDLRNHGKSPHSDKFSYEDMVEDLREFCETNYIFNCHLLGHSMGGKVAMQFAINYPAYIDKLIIADIAPVRYEPGHNEIFEALRKVDLSLIKKREEVDQILQEKISNYDVRQFLMKGLTRGEENKFEWKFNLTAIWKNYQNILSTFEASEPFEKPSLFISGGNSSYVNTSNYDVINHYFPNNSKEVIENVGHWLHAESPKVFYEKTFNFLSS
tara:strand:- start:1891 stop:2655 length:765 start_codon:yes stop_codon:yes gene_type:complete